MSEPFVFDPRCDLCKEPFGAVPCGTAVTFHCRPLATEGFSHCALVLSCEFSGTQREQELPLEGFAGERLCFSGTLTAPELPDLLWYHFRFWREDGTGCLLDKTGYRSDGQAVSWQLTVYQESRTPGWFGAGVTYQIFPDRFCRLPSDSTNTDGMVGNRWVHRRWDEMPEWRPHCPPELAGGAGVPTRRQRGDPQPGLLWWHSGGDHVETGRFEGPWCHHAVPLPHFRVRLQPPL